MPERKPLLLALALDVEEEGLFGGTYICREPSVKNTASLAKLAPLLERGAKPTLFCAFGTLCDASSRKVLEDLRDRHGAQIGAHLHHWNTPPYSLDKRETVPKMLRSVPAASVNLDLLGAKLDNLLSVANDFQGGPVAAFRMGRWDLHAPHWPLLAERGIVCDASVRPLHLWASQDGPDHFDAPADPYLVSAGGREILEVPLTVTPLVRKLASLPPAAQMMRANLRHWGALALLPVQHPLWLLKLTTKLHAARGGKVLSLTWHSSEMMAGGAPHMADEAAVARFLKKMEAYYDWLEDNFAITHVTMNDLATQKNLAQPVPPHKQGDWWGARQGKENLDA